MKGYLLDTNLLIALSMQESMQDLTSLRSG